MLKVMTRNLFIGADLTSAYEALTTDGELANLPAVVREIFNAEEPAGLVQRSNFPARASAFADEIDANRPDLIGIQEAPIWRTRDPSEPDAPTQAFDHLAMLEAEIAARPALPTDPRGGQRRRGDAKRRRGNRRLEESRCDPRAGRLEPGIEPADQDLLTASFRSRRRWVTSFSRAVGGRSMS